MTEEFKVRVGVELDPNSFADLKKTIDGKNIGDVDLKLSITDAEAKIKKISNQIKKLNNQKVNLNVNTGTNNKKSSASSIGSSMTYAVEDTEKVVKKLSRAQQEIQKLNAMKLDPNISVAEFDKIENKIKKLQSAYNNLYKNTKGKLSGEQIEILNVDWNKTEAQFGKALNRLETLQSEIKSKRFELSGLDASKDITEIKRLESELNGLQVEYNELYSTISKDLSSNQISALNKEFDAAIPAVKQTISAYNDLKATVKSMGSLELRLGKLTENMNPSEFAEISKQLTTLKNRYQELRNSMEGQLSTSQLAKLDSAVENTEKKLAAASAKFKDALRLEVDTGELSLKLQKINVEFDKIENKTDEVRMAMKNLGDANGEFNKLYESFVKGEIGIEKMADAYNELQIAARTAENAVKSANLNTISQIDRDNAILDAKNWLKANSKAAQQFKAEIDGITRAMESCDAVTFNKLQKQLKNVKKRAQEAGLTGLTMKDKLKTKITEYGAYFSVANIAMETAQAIRYMFQNVLEVDTAMTELKRVTDLSATQYSDLYDELTVSAREYGTTLTDIISATADWSRAGFDPNIAKGLAEVTTMYQHIADVDYQTAFENLETAYKGFETQLKQDFGGDTVAAVSYIGDILNELDNNFAVTADGVGEAIKRSASALNIAGNTIQETAGMVTGITEVTQDPEKAGNALKVLSMRLRGTKGQLEEMGEEVDENVTNLTKMQGQVLNLTHGHVNIFDDVGEFKSTYEIMEGIAEIYDELSSVEQADLLETIAGKVLTSMYRNVHRRTHLIAGNA